MLVSYWPFLHAWLQKHLLPRLADPTIDLWCGHQLLQEPFDTLKKEVTKAVQADTEWGDRTATVVPMPFIDPGKRIPKS